MRYKLIETGDGHKYHAFIEETKEIEDYAQPTQCQVCKGNKVLDANNKCYHCNGLGQFATQKAGIFIWLDTPFGLCGAILNGTETLAEVAQLINGSPDQAATYQYVYKLASEGKV